jgi:hypothetical protein
MTNPIEMSDTGPDQQRRILDHRLEEGAWGLFLVLMGALWLLPDSRVPDDLWLVVAGVIMLGLNAARSFNHLRVHTLTIILGAAAVLVGLAGTLGYDLPVLALLLIVLGVFLVVRQFLPKSGTPHAAPR